MSERKKEKIKKTESIVFITEFVRVIGLEDWTTGRREDWKTGRLNLTGLWLVRNQSILALDSVISNCFSPQRTQRTGKTKLDWFVAGGCSQVPGIIGAGVPMGTAS